ncbi:MAG: phosphatase PAP2 family protein [Vicinamibacterales bacterium]
MLIADSGPVASELAPSAGDTAGARRALWIGTGLLAVFYVGLFIGGTRFFVYKTAVLPVFLVYGMLLRERVAFARDWVPLLAATLLFDALRGAIYVAIASGSHDYYVEYVIALEQAVLGVPAVPVLLQTMRAPALDLAAVLIHGSHFAYFLLFGLVLWHARREHFPTFRRALVLVMAFGLVGYWAIPTAPPWLAAQQFDLPPVEWIVSGVYTHRLPELHRAFDTNPVAAMPSLHAAFPLMCALVGWQAYGRRIGTILSIYAALVAFSVMYLGEHYGVDVLAGVLVAVLATHLGPRMAGLGLSFRGAMGVSGLTFGLAALLSLFLR